MCNLNIIIKHTIDDNEELLSMLSTACYNSFVNNNDGDGVYFNSHDILMTSEEKINLHSFKEQFEKSNIIISHQRFTTSGKKPHNIQPFNKEGFVLAHNGVLSSFVSTKNDNSDSLNMFNQFLEHFKKSTLKDRNKAIIEAIKNTLNKVTGSYSIVLLDKKTNVLYYFKNGSTNINFIRNKEKTVLFITTSIQNKALFDVYNHKNKDLTIDNYTINSIRINHKGVITVTNEGKIKPQPMVVYDFDTFPVTRQYPKTTIYNSYAQYDAYGSIQKQKGDVVIKKVSNDELQKDLEGFKEGYNITTTTTLRPCSSNGCEEQTYNGAGVMSVILCDNCLIEEIKSFGYDDVHSIKRGC